MRITARVVNNAAKRLERAAEAASVAIPRAINKVASKAFTRSRREIRSRVNLTDKYLKDADKTGRPRLRLEKATARKPYAVIAARVRPTRLATYGAKQLRRKAKSGAKAKGDVLRKIPQGSKQAGVSVKVKRSGGRKKMPGAFLIPLKRGNLAPGTQGMGLFIRTGPGRNQIEHKYGPSVDQVFRGVRLTILRDVRKDLSETIRKQIKFEVGRG